MSKNTFSLVFLLLWSGIQLMGQSVVEGRISDTAGRPLADAHILQGGQHAHSDARGMFRLGGLQAGDTLRVTYLGYAPLLHIVQTGDFAGELRLVLTEDAFQLEQVTVSNAVRLSQRVADIDLQTTPINSAQELLRRVPGLFIAQHAGGGKAEQIFLRGFDIDHGTDINITVDGMPVNMVSHAHGQGYADLHFLIPETVERIDFGKGPYYAEQGNFTTAGYVAFKTKDRLAHSSIGLDVGDFETRRVVGLFDMLGDQEHQHAYVAGELLLSDGPFESPQQFNRVNLLGKYTLTADDGGRLSVLASHFQSKWDASGQIPQRLVDNGSISRFGSVDDTEGGQTSRSNLAIEHHKVLGSRRFLHTQAYFSHYRFELYSNFTFFLEDPINGDQIRQREARNIYGISSTLHDSRSLAGGELAMSYGIGLRYDDVNDNELSRSRNRQETLENLALGDVDESQLFAFVNAEWAWGAWRLNPSLRVDAFRFDYIDRLAPSYSSLSASRAIASPKLNIIYQPAAQWQMYLKTGTGFHSNDTRVVLAQTGREILPRAYGADLGAIWKPQGRLWLNAALWYLFLEQEFVYVGDAAVIEPSGRSLRQGLELGIRYQIGSQVFLDSDFSYTYARATEEAEGENYIPLAPDLSATGGLFWQHPSGFSAGLRYRYIRDRPANEDGSITALGYFVSDARLNYDWGKHLSLSLSVENLFDTEWNEAQFATESRLANEAAPVEELHFTPGVPRFAKATAMFHF